jgi:hypothetical protein
MIISISRESDGDIKLVFKADSDQDGVALKNAILVAAKGGISREFPLTVLDELEKAGYVSDEG